MSAVRFAWLCIGAASSAALLREVLLAWTRRRYGGLESLVSFSSRLIAAARAAESSRPDAFVVDPLAHILAGPKAMARYQYTNDQSHKCKQVVLLGAGMDTRPWRLDLPPGIFWFEVDRRDVLKAKQAELHRASADLQVTGWIHELVAAGLDLKQPVLWIAEGLLYYLEPESVRSMLQYYHAHASLVQWFLFFAFVSTGRKPPQPPVQAAYWQ
eukprot:gene2750-3045_t